ARRLGPIFEQGDEDVARFHGGDCFRSEVGPHCRQREVGEVGDCRSAAQALSGEFPAATDLALPPGGKIDRQTRRFEPHPIVLHPRARAEATTNSVATVFATGVAAAAIARLKLVRRDGRSIHPAASGNRDRPIPKLAPMMAPPSGPASAARAAVAQTPHVTTKVETPTPSWAPNDRP